MRKILFALAMALGLVANAQVPVQIPLFGNVGCPTMVACFGGYSLVIGDTAHTLSTQEWANVTLVVTSSVTLTGPHTITAPLIKGQFYVVENLTTGVQFITIAGTTGAGVNIAQGTSALVFCDGTQYILIGGTGVPFLATTNRWTNINTFTAGINMINGGNATVGNPLSSAPATFSGSYCVGTGNCSSGNDSISETSAPVGTGFNPMFEINWTHTGSSGGYRVNLPSGSQLNHSGICTLASLCPATSLAGAVVASAGVNYLYGDSLMAPYALGIGDSAIGGQMSARLSNDLLGQKVEVATSGIFLTAISSNVLRTFPINYNTTSQIPKVMIDAMTNDAVNIAVSTGGINNATLEYNAMLSWIEMPTANKVYASTATKTGTWTATAPLPLEASNTGGAEVSTVNASTLTFTTPAAGNKLGVTYYAPTTANAGTFTISIDGTLQTDVCSATTTFANTGCNSTLPTPVMGVFRQEFTVTSATTHTVVVTVTSSSGSVYILDADISPASKTNLPILMASGVIFQNADGQSAATAAYDGVNLAVVNQLSAWANVYRVDVRTGTPGVNSTTDMANGVPACPGGVTPLHPNSCGFVHWLQTFENAATAAGLNIFFPGLGTIPQGNLNQPLNVGVITSGDGIGTPGRALINNKGTANTIQGANPNFFQASVAPNSAVWSPLNCWYDTSVTSCDGLAWDVNGGNAFFTGFVSSFEMGLMHCASMGVAPSACRTDLWTEPTTGIVHTPHGFAPIARGMAVLAGGTVTVSTAGAAVPSANLTYTLTNCISGGTPGMLSVGTVTAGVSFVINSSSSSDTSSVCWQIN